MLTFYLSVIPTVEGQRYFEYLYYTYRDDMKAVAEYEMKHSDETEDALHDAFVSIANRVEKLHFDTVAKERAYMLTAAKNAARMILRKRRKYVQIEEENDIVDSNDDFDDFINRDFTKSEFDRLVNAIVGLDDKYKEILTLHYLMHMSDKEMSKTLNRKLGTVRSQIVRGRKLLMKAINEEKENV